MANIKRKMAQKMLSPDEVKKRGQKVGFILFESAEWVRRRENIAERVARQVKRAQDAKAVRIASLAKIPV
jgi:hypothetical protein